MANSPLPDGPLQDAVTTVAHRSFWQDVSSQSLMQGLVVAIVGYASSVAIVIKGLAAVGATVTVTGLVERLTYWRAAES